MTEHIEDYLNITEPIGYDNSVDNIEYIERNPVEGTDINKKGNIVLTIDSTSSWLLPCESYLYIEGTVLKADGTRITPIADKIWPDIALLNNFFPYMFSSFSYYVNSDKIEEFNFPGQCITLKHLLTKPRTYNGLDSGWELDTYDGQPSHINAQYHNMKTYADADFTAAGATPTAAEHDTFCQKIFTDFNEANPLNPVPAYAPGFIAALIANPPVPINIHDVINAMLDRFRDYLKIPSIPICTTTPADVLKATVLAFYNDQLVKVINKSLDQITEDVYSFNTGFKKRKEFLFDTVTNVMDKNEAGDFSFRIPLSYLFNFCEDYRKVMFKCKHELRLNRQTDYIPVLKSTTIDYKLTIKLNLLRWYMPVITPSINMRLLLEQQIANKTMVDLAFMNKTMDISYLPPNQDRFITQITYPGGVEKPRYLVAAFQTIDTANPKSNDNQYINYAIFNGTNLAGGNNLMIDIDTVNAKINGKSYTLMDFTNDANQNKIARWYNEYKKFKKTYRGDFNDDDMINFYEFRNLYRLYVFDISKQVEPLLADDKAVVSLEFKFNKPTTPQPATMKTELYVLSFFDSVYKLQSDGKRQFIAN